ncbi:MAG: LCP family protein [Anaerolineae bacterium]|nr:LCP family protein [Anaerolineae bacterium]
MREASPARHRAQTGCLALIAVVLLACGCGSLIYLIAPPPPLDILVLGLDARQGEGNEARADSLLLVGVNPPGLQVSLLSIPRDLRLDVPGYGVQPINTANMLGEMAEAGSGSPLTAAALEAPLDVGIDRTVRLRFEDVAALIDAAGGVTIDVERTIRDEMFPLSETQTEVVQFDPGMQWMDGERALQYARTRHADDDYTRAGRQQQVMQAFARQLRNPLTWPAVLGALGRIDTDLTFGDVLGLAPVIVLNAGRFEQRTLDRTLLVPASDGNSVVDWETLHAWVEPRFD